MKRYGRHLGGLLAVGVSLVCAQSASAATITVDNTTDTSGQACTVTGGDCSLRSAVETAAAQAGHDDINFDAAVFNGGATTPSVIDVGSTILIQSDVAIAGGDCDPGAGAKPCVGINSTGGLIGILVFTANPVTISGLAMWGTEGVAIASQSTQHPTVTGSWFGVKLDGTTLEANENGISLLNGTGATIGGTNLSQRNVFAGNTNSAISLGTTGSNTISGNRIGVLPGGGSVAAGAANQVGISIFGVSSNNTIGGAVGTLGQCDGACNLVVNQGGNGIGFSGAPNYGSQNAIQGNFVGLGADGTSDQGNGGRGIQVGDAAETTIGGLPETRNFIAGNGGEGIWGVGSTGAEDLVVTDNYVGLSADGETAIPNAGPVNGSNMWLFGPGNIVNENRFGGGGVRIAGGTNFSGNVIGLGPSDEDVGVTLAEPGIQVSGNNATVTGNTVGNIKGAGEPAILLESGASSTTVRGNYIGTTIDGAAAPNVASGIELGGSNALSNNVIGGTLPTQANVISNSGTDAIRQGQAGTGNSFVGNFGKNNGTGPNDLFIDLNNNGQGNLTNFVNDGIEPPSSVTIGATSASAPTGSARSLAGVAVYATYTGRGDARKPLGYTTAAADGSWSLNFPAQVAGQCIAVQQTDTSGNSSELAIPVAVGGGACVLSPVTSLTGGPSEGSATNDPTPTFTFTGETGGTLQCRIDGDPTWAPCPTPYTTPTLDDGPHGFHVRTVATPFKTALGSPEVGAEITRSFSVDTIAPTTTFTSGPAQGETIKVSSTSIGFSADEAAIFECSVDGGAFSACTSPKALTGLSDGSHSLAVRATDQATNTSPVVTRNFSVDTSVPVVPVVPQTPVTPATPPAKKCKKPKKKGKNASASAKCKKAKKKKK